MNIDRGKETFTLEEEADLQRRTLEFKTSNGYGWNRVGELTGTAPGSVSVWAVGKYNSGKGSQELCTKLWRFFLHQQTQEELNLNAPIVPDYQPTKTAKRVAGALSWAHRGKLAVVVGDPGLGKTAAVDQYCAVTTNCWKATMSPSTSSVHSMLLRVLRAMGLHRTGGANHLLIGLVRERVANRGALLIIDEAQHLDEKALEELRALHDETGCGMVLVGNREVLTRVEGASRAAAFAQLYSRISVRLILAKPFEEDVSILLQAWGVTDERERAFLRGIAMTLGGGGVRSLTNTLEYATILAIGDEENARVLDHLKQAWATLSARSATA